MEFAYKCAEKTLSIDKKLQNYLGYHILYCFIILKWILRNIRHYSDVIGSAAVHNDRGDDPDSGPSRGGKAEKFSRAPRRLGAPPSLRNTEKKVFWKKVF